MAREARQNLRNHSGQVAFPGGKRDAEDDSLLTTALREAEEEIALPRGEVDVLGALDDLVTITGYSDYAVRRLGAERRRAHAEPDRGRARLPGAAARVPRGAHRHLPARRVALRRRAVWGATSQIILSLMLIRARADFASAWPDAKSSRTE